MRNIVPFLILVWLSLGLSAALAEVQTVKLSVPGMTCASCPYMVKQVISTLDGVMQVTASWEAKTATVTFDDAIVSTDAIREATASIGYRSTLIETPGS